MNRPHLGHLIESPNAPLLWNEALRKSTLTEKPLLPLGLQLVFSSYGRVVCRANG